ncbi:Peptidase 1 [Sarcoptes scabiei]|nr:Peptidase 1 [Sarcoptes scabiei]
MLFFRTRWMVTVAVMILIKQIESMCFLQYYLPFHPFLLVCIIRRLMNRSDSSTLPQISRNSYEFYQCRSKFSDLRNRFCVNYCRIPSSPTTASLPIMFDLRTEQKLTLVKDEKSCHSSWAFATVASIESMQSNRTIFFNTTRKDLSSQQLIDCVGWQGCTGGVDVIKALNYARIIGLVEADLYPYRERRGFCKNIFFLLFPHQRIRAFCLICSTDVDSLKRALFLYRTPLITVLKIRNSTAFNAISKDIVMEDIGTTITSQRVVNLVGWGRGYSSKTNQTVDYWIVRNSQGEKWGHNGYAYIIQQGNLFNILDQNYLIN